MNRGPEAPEELRRLQEAFGRAVRQPFSFASGTMRCLPDAYPAAAAEAARPRDRQGPRERLAVYNEQYWFRLLTVMQDHYPLLARALGYWEFNQLATDYLADHPSRRPFLEDLAWNLPAWLRGSPRFGAPRALQIAEADLAALRAFHARGLPSLDPRTLDPEASAALADTPLELQPWLTLLEEDWDIAANRRRVCAHEEAEPEFAAGKGYWAVYRHDGLAHWMPLERPAFRVLSALQAGETLGEACDSVGGLLEGDEADAFAAGLGAWFAAWTGLGWFAAPGARRADPVGVFGERAFTGVNGGAASAP